MKKNNPTIMPKCPSTINQIAFLNANKNPKHQTPIETSKNKKAFLNATTQTKQKIQNKINNHQIAFLNASTNKIYIETYQNQIISKQSNAYKKKTKHKNPTKQ